MATTPASSGELSVTVEVQQRERISAVEVRRKLKTLKRIVFCIAFLEWAGNAVGTLAFIWATVVLLGGFSSLLTRVDFWFATVMIFMEGSRVFIRNDASANQWLFGSTRAFRWEDFSFPRMLVGQSFGKISVVFIGVGVSYIPEFRPEIAIASSILKVAFLVIISQLLTRVHRGSFSNIFLALMGVACVSGAIYGYVKTGTVPLVSKISMSKHDTLTGLKVTGLVFAWLLGTMLLIGLAIGILSNLRFMRNPVPLLCFKIFIASALACLPFLQATLAAYYKIFSITVAAVLLLVSNEYFWGEGDGSSSGTSERYHFSPETTWEQNSSFCGLFLQILETILPILFFWSVMFPLPGLPFSLKISFYMLFSVIVGVLIANLQVPVAFLQVLLSILRLRNLLGHHRHDYIPLPDGASPNLVPSIMVFFMLELCQGSSYILAVILGFISLLRRVSLARDLEFKQEWGAKALSLYFSQAYQARMETGLFRQEKEKDLYTDPRLDLESFAIQSLGCTSSHEMQIVGLRILDNSLQRGDSESNKKLVTEIVKDAKNIITNIIGLISCYLTIVENSIWAQIPLGTLEEEDSRQHYKNVAEKMEVARLCLEFVRTIAINGGKISARFRKELSENPFFVDSLDRILRDGLREQVMGIVATLAVDEAARKEIGNTQSLIRKLMYQFKPSIYNGHGRSSLRMAAGEALANLTINSADSCWAILLVEPEHDLFKMLIDMLDDEYYICVAANLLHNLCANSRDMLIDLGADVNLGSALSSHTSQAMEIIRAKEGKQLEAALCVASQIGYVIPEYVAQELDPYTDAAASEQLVTKLVDTLKSNREYPRIRRVLVEVVISIVELCPGYKKIFKAKGAKDALDMVKGTPSRLENYRVFLDGEGVVPESLTMRDLVDNAKRLIYNSNSW